MCSKISVKLILQMIILVTLSFNFSLSSYDLKEDIIPRFNSLHVKSKNLILFLLYRYVPCVVSLSCFNLVTCI